MKAPRARSKPSRRGSRSRRACSLRATRVTDACTFVPAPESRSSGDRSPEAPDHALAWPRGRGHAHAQGAGEGTSSSRRKVRLEAAVEPPLGASPSRHRPRGRDRCRAAPGTRRRHEPALGVGAHAAGPANRTRAGALPPGIRLAPRRRRTSLVPCPSAPASIASGVSRRSTVRARSLPVARDLPVVRRRSSSRAEAARGGAAPPCSKPALADASNPPDRTLSFEKAQDLSRVRSRAPDLRSRRRAPRSPRLSPRPPSRVRVLSG
jgi:hypothetical protein